MSTITRFTNGIRLDGYTVFVVAVFLGAQVSAVVGYLRLTGTAISDPLILVYPFIWINVGIFAVVTTSPAPTSLRKKRIGALVGSGYFVILAVAGGIVSLGAGFSASQTATGFRFALVSVPPGWGPAVMYSGEFVTLVFVPYELIGYLALSYLVYVTVLDVSGTVVSGVVGLFSCVSCSWPVLGLVLTSVFGGSSAIVAFATGQPYGFSTFVFLSAVALLYWRPFH